MPRREPDGGGGMGGDLDENGTPWSGEKRTAAPGDRVPPPPARPGEDRTAGGGALVRALFVTGYAGDQSCS